MDTKKAIQIEVDQWNDHNMVGCSVTVEMDMGGEVSTFTKSEAFVSDSGHAVIQIKGISGFYLLSRVTPNVVKAADVLKVLPCPFCGAMPDVQEALNYTGTWIVACRNFDELPGCEILPSTKWFLSDGNDDGRTRAIVSWNKRAETGNSDATNS